MATEYDELIKWLRYLAKVYSICENTNTQEYKLAVEAADAIESTSKAYQMMAEAYEREVTKPKWIPVTERLPDNHEYVLCCGSKGGMFVGRVGSCNYGDAKAMGFVHGGHGRYLTHWMPLPEPPESGDK